MVSAADTQSGGPVRLFHSGDLLDLFLIVPSLTPQPDGVFNLVMLHLDLFVSKYLSEVPVNYS